jgi:hypothetical protein
MGRAVTTFMALCRMSTVGYPENPTQRWRENPAEINVARSSIFSIQKPIDFSMRRHYTEDMAEKRRPTINSILKDPAASDWLKAAVRSALECDPADVMRDAQTLVTLMIGYTSRFGYPARRQWPRKKATP